jgi:hypothetical protein
MTDGRNKLQPWLAITLLLLFAWGWLRIHAPGEGPDRATPLPGARPDWQTPLAQP